MAAFSEFFETKALLKRTLHSDIVVATMATSQTAAAAPTIDLTVSDDEGTAPQDGERARSRRPTSKRYRSRR